MLWGDGCEVGAACGGQLHSEGRVSLLPCQPPTSHWLLRKVPLTRCHACVGACHCMAMRPESSSATPETSRMALDRSMRPNALAKAMVAITSVGRAAASTAHTRSMRTAIMHPLGVQMPS